MESTNFFLDQAVVGVLVLAAARIMATYTNFITTVHDLRERGRARA
jgi:hypothetical protein